MVNLCGAKFILRNVKQKLHFLLFLNTKMAQVVEILPCGRQKPFYPAWLLIWFNPCGDETSMVQENKIVTNCCWCPGSLYGQAISSHSIEYLG